MTPPVPVPTLDQLAADTTLALTLPADVRRRLALHAIAVAHALSVVEAGSAPVVVAEQPERLLTKREAAQRLGIAPGTLEHRTKVWPWSTFRIVQPGRRPQYHGGRISEFLRDPEGYAATAGAARTIPSRTRSTGARQ